MSINVDFPLATGEQGITRKAWQHQVEPCGRGIRCNGRKISEGRRAEAFGNPGLRPLSNFLCPLHHSTQHQLNAEKKIPNSNTPFPPKTEDRWAQNSIHPQFAFSCQVKAQNTRKNCLSSKLFKISRQWTESTGMNGLLAQGKV
ncbi:uncharacterized protein [Alexandromys fortis]|uniref:uncharacterized protein isoform X4 n=1 Tax=Alexandromys fortis TaxID=100897 RepID=UPI0021538310|nr:uncharacterized protein LOC126499088 isoform X4 [Microtus fortis]XP_049994090.1 uncharacterized protein LOC126499088 isoform X5 [Microtus fortis]